MLHVADLQTNLKVTDHIHLNVNFRTIALCISGVGGDEARYIYEGDIPEFACTYCANMAAACCLFILRSLH